MLAHLKKYFFVVDTGASYFTMYTLCSGVLLRRVQGKARERGENVPEFFVLLRRVQGKGKGVKDLGRIYGGVAHLQPKCFHCTAHQHSTGPHDFTFALHRTT